MMVETARVIAVDGDEITVEAAIKTTCNACQAQSDCGTGAIAKAIAPKSQQLTFKTPVAVSVGDEVNVGIPEQGIMLASALLYVVPLLVLVISAVLLERWFGLPGSGGDLVVFAGSSLATLASFVAISRHLKKMDKGRFQPVLISKQSPSE
ncbi:SoxR reducing system RseC family protein [Alteromonas sp. CYL-A6]|uniref:SoxR reducing system RseC family protein n=1 Tax=Alteromonas nitratireducens TaxID=3390813 RepID=UPI0034B38A9A